MNKEKHGLQQVQQVLYDLLKGFLFGAAAGIIVALVLFLAGFFIGGMSLAAGLETAKNGLLLIGALGLFILAGMILVKGKKPERFSAGNGWRRHFKAVGIKSVIGAVCVAILIIASVADYLILWMKG